jgi:hypothetical protein
MYSHHQILYKQMASSLLLHFSSCLAGDIVQVYRLPFSPSIKCNVLRESLSCDCQNIPCAKLKRRGSWVIPIYLWTPNLTFPITDKLFSPVLSYWRWQHIDDGPYLTFSINDRTVFTCAQLLALAPYR